MAHDQADMKFTAAKIEKIMRMHCSRCSRMCLAVTSHMHFTYAHILKLKRLCACIAQGAAVHAFTVASRVYTYLKIEKNRLGVHCYTHCVRCSGFVKLAKVFNSLISCVCTYFFMSKFKRTCA